MSHVYCPECGFQNPESANYCSKCGALLHAPESGEQTETFSPAVREELIESLGELEVSGPALVVRSGGGRTGETFAPQGDRTTIGRSPDCPVFLDDVTVSRRHAEFHRSGDTFTVSDVGSLNGTYVNRDRIDRVQLTDGDEVQIGKYRLVFFAGHAAR